MERSHINSIFFGIQVSFVVPEGTSVANMQARSKKMVNPAITRLPFPKLQVTNFLLDSQVVYCTSGLQLVVIIFACICFQHEYAQLQSQARKQVHNFEDLCLINPQKFQCCYVIQNFEDLGCEVLYPSMHGSCWQMMQVGSVSVRTFIGIQFSC